MDGGREAIEGERGEAKGAYGMKPKGLRVSTRFRVQERRGKGTGTEQTTKETQKEVLNLEGKKRKEKEKGKTGAAPERREGDVGSVARGGVEAREGVCDGVHPLGSVPVPPPPRPQTRSTKTRNSKNKTQHKVKDGRKK